MSLLESILILIIIILFVNMFQIWTKKHIVDICAEQFIRGSVFSLLTGGGLLASCVNGIVWCQSNVLAGAVVKSIKGEI